MRLVLLLCLALASLASLASAADFADKVNQPQDDQELEKDYFRDLEKTAAKYRLGRASATADEKDDADAKRYLDDARRLLTDHPGFWQWWQKKKARKTALKGFKLHPYSKYAGELVHVAMLGYALENDLSGMLDELVTLWLCFPEYPEMDSAMRVALETAEKAQGFTKIVHLEAHNPADVIDVDGAHWRDETNRLFRFIAHNGDRATVAPRAQLGLARSLMISEDRSKGFATVRGAYETFLDQYPDSDLTFTALCELALAYLRTYRGEHYDIGALDHASTVIDQAEVETKGDAARAKTVAAYRRRIHGWLQDRDFQVAEWYMYPTHLPFGIFLGTRKPDAARFYYQQVVDRDPSTEKARLAKRELAKLGPAPTPAYETRLLGEAAR